jgi:hypothetical protein
MINKISKNMWTLCVISNMWRAVKLKEFLELCKVVGNIRLMGFKFGSPIQKYVLHFAGLR